MFAGIYANMITIMVAVVVRDARKIIRILKLKPKVKKVLIFKYATALIWGTLIKWLKQRQKVDREFHSIMLLP